MFSTPSSQTDVARVARRYFAAKIFIVAVAFVAFFFSFGEGLEEDNYVYRVPRVTSFVDRFMPFDGQWYVQIAEQGYRIEPLYVNQRSINFFPLYPALIALLAPLVGAAAAGLVISYAAGFGAVYLLYRLLRQDYSAVIAGDTVWYVLIFPTAVVLSAVYTESLFLCLAIGALYAGRQRHWGVAALLGALAALTRSVGGLILIPLVVQYWAMHEWKISALLRAGAIFCIIPLAVFGYLGYVAALTGDVNAYRNAMAEGWLLHPTWPHHLFEHLTQRKLFGYRNGILDLGAGIVFVGLLPFIVRRLRPEYAAYAAVFTLVFWWYGNTASWLRYVFISWPHFLLLAELPTSLGRWRHWMLSAALLLALTGFTLRFTNWQWIG